MATLERIEALVKEIFSKPVPPPHKRAWSGPRSVPLPDNWNEIRACIIERDGVCIGCGNAGHGVHHKDENRTHNDNNNLVYLCWDCHSSKHH